MKNIDKVRRIRKNHQWEKIDGMIVDSYTASAIIEIDESLNEENRKKFENIINTNFKRGVDITWKIVGN
jgi:hypothetical protein